MTGRRISFLILAAGVLPSAFFGQNLPITWSQSYGTYDLSRACRRGSYAVGFGVNNFALYAPSDDSVAYDERRFDLWAKYGLDQDWEFELKYSHPTCLVLALKHQLMVHPVAAAAKLGFGYMKGTRANYLTDYVYDLYPGVIMDHALAGPFRIYAAPRAIFSIHQKDRQEHTKRPLRFIQQYGFGLGVRAEGDFAVALESNWFWANNEGVTYIVNQFGIGINAVIK